jgi:geranylgeranyl diphosphate synthase type II
MQLPESPANLYDPMRYILQLEAKRIRPALVIMGCNVFSDEIHEAIAPALAIEVFHNFTLMHDDIMDNSDLRRKNPTVHVKWNPNIGILSGDAMVIKAYELLSKGPIKLLPFILPVFNRTALQVCEGQQCDMDYEQLATITIEQYLKMIEYKTASLLAASLKIGSLLGGATEHESDLLFEFGRNIGIAFQLQDDLLDAFADPEVFGKVTGNDIVANKKTILLVEALNKASGKERLDLLHWISLSCFDKEDKVKAVTSIYRLLDLEQSVNQRILHFHQIAIDHMKALEVEQHRKSPLLAFSNSMLYRKK